MERNRGEGGGEEQRRRWLRGTDGRWWRGTEGWWWRGTEGRWWRGTEGRVVRGTGEGSEGQGHNR